MRSRLATALLLLLAFVAADAVRPALGWARPLNGRGMWIWYLSRSEGGDVGAIAARARAAGVDTVFVKSSDGVSSWSQFTPGLVSALRARGLHVCAWQYVYGTHP